MGMRRRASACMCVSLQLAFMQADRLSYGRGRRVNFWVTVEKFLMEIDGQQSKKSNIDYFSCQCCA